MSYIEKLPNGRNINANIAMLQRRLAAISFMWNTSFLVPEAAVMIYLIWLYVVPPVICTNPII
jgi:hypothetical protein